MKLFSNRFLFNLGSGIYDRLTDQDVWRRQIGTVLNHMDAMNGPPLRILDLGCGPGVSTFALAEVLGEQAELIGVDIAEGMIRKAKTHHQSTYRRFKNITFQVADATTLPFATHAFDLAVGHSFLYLVPQQVHVLQEVRRVLRPLGRLVLMEPRREGSLLQAIPEGWNAWRRNAQSSTGIVRFATSMVAWRCVSRLEGQMDQESITQLFTQAGFPSIECHTTLGGLGWHCVGTTEASASLGIPMEKAE